MFPSSFRLACVIADEKRENLVPQQRICAGQRWTCHHRLQSRWSIDPLLCWVAQQAQATGGSVVGLCANARKGDRFTRSTHARAIALPDQRTQERSLYPIAAAAKEHEHVACERIHVQLRLHQGAWPLKPLRMWVTPAASQGLSGGAIPIDAAYAPVHPALRRFARTRSTTRGSPLRSEQSNHTPHCGRVISRAG
jgi:hypothetical protein